MTMNRKKMLISLAMAMLSMAGLFNGSGLTGQKDYWTKSVNFSAKAQLFFLPEGFNVTLSTQNISPADNSVMMYDAGTYWHSNG